MAPWARVRPLAAVASAPFCASFLHRAPIKSEEKKEFKAFRCTQNEPHTHNTRKVTLDCGGQLTGTNAIVNVLVRAPVVGSSCCACCKCGPNCSCPKKPCGCCDCCKCPEPCTCPKAKPAETSCCACCKCGPDCGCPKKPSGCCACCSCPEPCKCPKSKKGETIRPYNPISLAQDGTLTLLVKKYENALMGTYIHNLQVGETIDVKGPNKQWQFEKGKFARYGLIAGGTGLTPLIQAAEHILANDTAKVTLVCLNKSVEDMLLVKELDALRHRYPDRLHVEHIVEAKSEAASPGHVSTPRIGVASASTLKWLMPAPSASVLVLVCGPKEMTEKVAGAKAPDFSQGEVSGYLKELGYKSSQVWKV